MLLTFLFSVWPPKGTRKVLNSMIILIMMKSNIDNYNTNSLKEVGKSSLF